MQQQPYYPSHIILDLFEEKDRGRLWLGDYCSGKNGRLQKDRKVILVITAGLGMKVNPPTPIKHKLLPVYDHPSQAIDKYFEQAYDQIEDALQNGNVLVHCYAGVSRSASIVISYVMKKMSWSYKYAFEYVKKKRWCINPNPGFVKQLKKYQLSLTKMRESEIFKKIQSNNESTVNQSSTKAEKETEKVKEDKDADKDSGKITNVLALKSRSFSEKKEYKAFESNAIRI